MVSTLPLRTNPQSLGAHGSPPPAGPGDLSDISRDTRLFLRDKLSAVLGFAELLTEGACPPERQRRYAEQIVLASEDILRQIVVPAAAREERSQSDCDCA